MGKKDGDKPVPTCDKGRKYLLFKIKGKSGYKRQEGLRVVRYFPNAVWERDEKSDENELIGGSEIAGEQWNAPSAFPTY